MEETLHRAPPAPCQLAFDLPHPTNSALTDFLPAASNAAALDAVLRWPSWPGPALLLVGPPAAGKSHLARIWAARAGAVLLGGAELWAAARPLARLGEASSCVVDDAESVLDEEILFHLYNRIAERRGGLMLTATVPIPEWNLRLPDLRSRLRTAWTVRIDPPDDALLAALLVKQFADRQLRVDAGVIDFLVPRMERSFAGARHLVVALDRASLRARRPVTLALARAVLDEIAGVEA